MQVQMQVAVHAPMHDPGRSCPFPRERATLLGPSPVPPSDPWIELNFLLVVAGLVLLNLLLRQD